MKARRLSFCLAVAAIFAFGTDEVGAQDETADHRKLQRNHPSGVYWSAVDKSI